MISEISKHDLIAAVDEVFCAMAGMQLTPSEVLVRPDRKVGYVVSAVQIMGVWQGAVRLDTDIGLAREVCGKLLGVDPAGLSQEEIRDAAGELANITGGSVKALLAPTCSLSLPTVVIGSNYEFSLPQGKIVQESGFCHESGNLLVTIIEKPHSN